MDEEVDIQIWSSAVKVRDMAIQDFADLAKIPDDFNKISDFGAVTNLSDNVVKLLNLKLEKNSINANNEDQPSSPAFFAILIAAMK